MGKTFQLLKKALEEVIEYQKGNIELRASIYELDKDGIMRKIVKKKKSVDVDKEVNGASVGPATKKDKYTDLTQDIKLFLNTEITHDSLKKVLMRLHERINDTDLKTSSIKIIKISWSGYVIVISQKRRFESEFYINHMTFLDLAYWKEKNMITSRLKQELAYKIYDWLTKTISDDPA